MRNKKDSVKTISIRNALVEYIHRDFIPVPVPQFEDEGRCNRIKRRISNRLRRFYLKLKDLIK